MTIGIFLAFLIQLAHELVREEEDVSESAITGQTIFCRYHRAQAGTARKRRGVPSIRSDVANLSDFIKEEISLPKIKRLIVHGYTKSFNMTLRPKTISDEEQE